MEAALEEFEKMFGRTLNGAAIFALALDPDGKIIFLNDFALKILVCRREEAEGVNWFNAFVPEGPTRETSQELFEKIKSGSEEIAPALEQEIVNKHGERRFLTWNQTLIRGGGGETLAVLCVGEDITNVKEAGNELKKANEFFGKVMDGATNAIFVLNLKGEFILANNSCARISGYDVDELMGRSFAMLIAPEKLPRVQKQFIDTSISGIPYSRSETEIIRKDGQRRIIEFSASPLEGGGKIVSVVGTAEDITDRRRAEEESEKQSAFIKNVLESLAHPLYVIDAEDYTIKMANSATGFGEVSGKSTCYKLIHGSDKPCDGVEFPCPLMEVRKTKKPVTYKHVHLDRRGNERIMELHGYPVFDSFGNVAQMIEYSLDVTDREQVDREIRKSRRRYIDIIENIAEAIIEINDKGVIHIWNKAAEEMFGYSAVEAVGSNLTMIIPPSQREAHLKGLARAVETGEGKYIGKPIELEGVRKGGELFPVELLISITSDEEGERRFTGILRNLTEARKNRERLIRAESLSTVGTFISSIAHELNNPLTSVLGYSEMLSKERGLPESIKADVDTIVGEARRSAGIVRSLLNFVRKQREEKKPANINDIVKKTLDLKMYQLRVENIKVSTSFEDRLPRVMGHGGELGQVMLNLLQNAHHAVQDHDGRGRIDISTYERDGMVVVEIFNSGSPIPESNLSRIFEPFFTTKAGERGTGLGLSISSGIVNDHSGTLRVMNTDEGVVFTVAIPACSDKDATQERKGAPKVPDGKGKLAIVADDEPTVRSLVSRYLRKAGFEVVEAVNGKDALAKLEQSRFDLAIIDLLMPDMDGFSLFRKIKERWPYLLRRIIFASGMVEEKAAAFAREMGCDILEKPFEKTIFYSAVADVLERGGGEG